MLVRRPDRPQNAITVNRPLISPRNPNAFQGWGPKL
jgi:hypothetical protein